MSPEIRAHSVRLIILLRIHVITQSYYLQLDITFALSTKIYLPVNLILKGYEPNISGFPNLGYQPKSFTQVSALPSKRCPSPRRQPAAPSSSDLSSSLRLKSKFQVSEVSSFRSRSKETSAVRTHRRSNASECIAAVADVDSVSICT